MSDAHDATLLERWAAWAREQEFYDRSGMPGQVEDTFVRDRALYLRVRFLGEARPRELRLVLDDETSSKGEFVRTGRKRQSDPYGWRPRPDARLVIETQAHTPTRAAQVRRTRLVEKLATALAQAVEDVVDGELQMLGADATVDVVPSYVAEQKQSVYKLTIQVGLSGVDEPLTLALRQKVVDLLSRRDREAWDGVLAWGEVEEVSATRFTLKTFVGDRALPNIENRLHLHAPRRRQ